MGFAGGGARPASRLTAHEQLPQHDHAGTLSRESCQIADGLAAIFVYAQDLKLVADHELRRRGAGELVISKSSYYRYLAGPPTKPKATTPAKPAALRQRTPQATKSAPSGKRQRSCCARLRLRHAAGVTPRPS
jgi:hypothetical protein